MSEPSFWEGYCKHYDGLAILNDKPCRAGVDVRKLVGGPDFGVMMRSPCLKSHLGNPGVPDCPDREWTTPEEAAEVDQIFDKAIQCLQEGKPLPEGVTARTCTRRDMEPWSHE